MVFRNTIATSATLVIVATALISSAAPQQPKIGARVSPILKVGGLSFKDLNRNGVLDPYEDWRLPVDRRVADLLSRMTVEEKAGLMFHASIMGVMGADGEVSDRPTGTLGAPAGRGAAAAPPQPTGVARAIRGRTNPYNIEAASPAPVKELILQRGIRWAVIRPGSETPEVTAKFVNNLQEIAEGSRLGIPMTPSDNPGSGIRRGFMGVENASDNTRDAAEGRPSQVAQCAWLVSHGRCGRGERTCWHHCA